jgi:hypothetical protein
MSKRVIPRARLLFNLKHKVDDEGVEKIHPNANSWMENLKNAITVVLKGKCN